MTSDLQNATNNFPSAATRAANAIRSIIQSRRLSKEYLSSADFSEVRNALENIDNYGDTSEYWGTLSILGRAASVSKPAEKCFKPIIIKLISAGIPPFTSLAEGEDRYYLAKALEYSPNPDVVKLAFAEIAGEDTAETARSVWLKIALQSASTKQNFLESLNSQLSNSNRISALPPDSLVRRARRINIAVLDPLITSEIPPGNSYGPELRRFFTDQFQSRPPEETKLKHEFSLEIINAVHRVVRLNFSAASDPAVYLIASDIKRWWLPSTPPLELEQSIHQLIRSGLDALHVFARQGVRNKPLREALVQSSALETVKSLAQEIAATDSSLNENISYWFVSGRELDGRRSTETIEQLGGARLDEYIGRLLISSSAPDLNAKSLSLTAERIADLLPDEAVAVRSAAGHLAQIGQWARAIARSRHVELLYERGELREYDPTLQYGNETLVIGSRVRVITPGVVKAEDGRPNLLIIKAEVSE